ncbi:MAG: hypothetical protein AAGF87_10270 [Bacteroidota bacterium]
MNRKIWQPFLIFIFLSLALRWGTSWFSAINNDESTYLLIAREIMDGKVYLKDVIDTKPIGIFWLYAALIKLTGGSLFAIRMATHLVIACTAFACFLAGRRASGQYAIGLVAGVTYIFANSIYSRYGIGPNSETFLNLLTVSVVAIGVAPRVRLPKADSAFWHWPLMGFLLGTAVIIKPFAAAESLAIGLFMLWYYWVYRREWGRGLFAGALLVFAFCIPLAIVYAYHHSLGMTEELLYYTFEVNSRYPVPLAWYKRLQFIGDYLLRFFMFSVPAGVALLAAKRGVNRTWVFFLLGYFLLVSIMILLPGRRFAYYQIQLHPALCLLAAAFFDPAVEYFSKIRNQLASRNALVAVVCLAVLLGFAHYYSFSTKPDRPRMIAAYFEDKLAEEELFFTVTSHQGAYYLMDKPLPARFVHTPLMFHRDHVAAFEIDEVQEGERILANPNLKYLVRHPRNEAFFTPLSERLFSEFTLVDSIDAEMYVWERGVGE